jgi:hypothetical protein
MLDWLRYRYGLWQLQSEKKRSERNALKIWLMGEEEAKLKRVVEGRDPRLIDDDISQLMSDYIEREAQKLFLSVPEFTRGSDKWEKSGFVEHWRLTQATMLELRSAIRAEKKERSELARSWLAGLTGLIGVIIGLLAVILGRR